MNRSCTVFSFSCVLDVQSKPGRISLLSNSGRCCSTQPSRTPKAFFVESEIVQPILACVDSSVDASLEEPEMCAPLTSLSEITERVLQMAWWQRLMLKLMDTQVLYEYK